jgi:hypothetical protein
VSDEVKIEDLPKTITGSLCRQNRVILCDRCNGFGFRETEELTDYHKREYTTSRNKCSRCEGDGRLIESVEHLSLNLGNDRINRMPYASFHDIVDPHGYSDKWGRWRLDFTDLRLEDKYPELKAVNYDNYDRLVEYYRTVELLKKEHNNE